MLKSSLILSTLALSFTLTACSPSSPAKSTTSQQPTPQTTPSPSAHAAALAREQQLENYAQQLDAIPPPAKTRYMAVTSSSRWQNPFLTIHPDSVDLRIPAPSAPPAKRTRRSRRKHTHRPTAPLWQTTTLTLDALPAALAALPETNWPYGRVIATEDDLSGTSSNKVQVRRNEEKVLNLLNNLGVVTYEWPQNHKR
ncbi:MAG: hypothetical protein ACP5M4_07690 [Acidobacteriaceae bacterium]